MTTERIQDTINFQLRADTVVTNDTVKVQVTVNSLVTTDTTESIMRRDIKEVLSNFISAEWNIFNVNRTSDSTGLERITLSAVARVNETENYNLENRARAVSRQGLQLSVAIVDGSIPAPKLEEAERKLRLEILAKAKEEAAEASKISGREYRVASVDFANQGDPMMRKGVNLNNSMMYTAQASSFGGAAPGGADETLSNTQKVSLAADVQLAVLVD